MYSIKVEGHIRERRITASEEPVTQHPRQPDWRMSGDPAPRLNLDDPGANAALAGGRGITRFMEPNPQAQYVFPEGSKKRPAVVIADDHMLMAEGLAKLVEGDFNVVAKVDNGRELLRAAAQRPPDLALIDVSMPEMTGMETARKLLEIAPDCKVILVSMHSQAEMVREAFRAGASGYVLKRSAAAELLTAMWEVIKGNAYVSSSISKEALSSLLAPAPRLTARQREVLRLVAEGCSAKEIAVHLGIAVKTAQFHKTSILTRLDIRTTADLIKYALDRGICS
jgi:DNA-binding NarL/FixJ family response regulator